jgi:hypothetical protein
VTFEKRGQILFTHYANPGILSKSEKGQIAWVDQIGKMRTAKGRGTGCVFKGATNPKENNCIGFLTPLVRYESFFSVCSSSYPRSEKLFICTVPSGKLARISNFPPIASIWLRNVEIYMSVRFSIFAMAGC